MKKNITSFCLIFLFFIKFSFAQQAIPIDLQYSPRANTFSISGVGGGNLEEFKTESRSASAQLAMDFNIPIKDGKTKDGKTKLKTLTTLIKFNPTAKTNYAEADSININKIAFVDNQFWFLMGLRFSTMTLDGKLKNHEVPRFISTFFADFSVTPYSLDSKNPEMEGFMNFNTIAGYQFGFNTNTGFGLVGVNLSLQSCYVFIYDKKTGDQSFDQLIGVKNPELINKNLSRSFAGFGAKLSAQINDLAVFIEGRRYFALDNSVEIPDFSNRVIFSVGAIATGTIFKNKTKSKKLKD